MMAQVMELHACIEQLSNLKEMRTPVLLRAMIRWMAFIIFPVFLGYCSKGLHYVTNGMSGMVAILQLFVRTRSCPPPAAPSRFPYVETLERCAIYPKL